MNRKNIEANTRLAELRGWTNIFDAGGVLMGTPTSDAPSSRGQAPVPDWCGDWQACGPLLAEFGLPYMDWVHGWLLGVQGHKGTNSERRNSDLRYVIVLAAIDELSVRKAEKTA